MGVLKVILIIVGVLLTLAGLAGIGLYATYTVLPGPIYLRNNFIGVWLSLLVTFFSLEFIYCVVKAEWRVNSVVSHVFNVSYYILVALGGAFIALAYGLVWRLDSIVIGGVIALLALLSVFVLVVRRRNLAKNKTKPSSAKSRLLAARKSNVKTVSEPSEKAASTRSNLNLLDKDTWSSRKDGCCKTTLRLFNALLKIFWLLVLVLLCMGAFEIGIQTFKYPARGKFMSVKLADNSNRSLRIHYLCSGPSNSSQPTFVFEGDGAHGHADYLGLQRLMSRAGRRSCIWDKAGLGYSDFLFSDMVGGNYSLYYDRFVRELVARGEKAPFVWVAWGGGGSIVYSYAQKSPDMVASITLVDSYPAQYEWNSTATLKKMTKSQLDSYISFDMAKRYLMVYIINDFGVPLGLMRYFYPKIKIQPAELSEEVRWYFLTEKTWATQRYVLDKLRTQPNVYDRPLKSNTNVNHIMTVKSDEQVIKQTCEVNKWSASSSECSYEIKANKYSIDVRRSLVRSGGQVIECKDDDCDQAYFVYRNPQFTVDSLLTLYP